MLGSGTAIFDSVQVDLFPHYTVKDTIIAQGFTLLEHAGVGSIQLYKDYIDIFETPVTVGTEGLLDNIVKGIKTFFSKLIGWIQSFIEKVKAFIKNIISKVMAFIANIKKRFFSSSTNVTDSTALETIVTNIKDKMSKISRPVILKDEVTAIYDFAFEMKKYLPSLLSDIHDNLKGNPHVEKNGNLIQQALNENSIKTKLPQWLKEALQKNALKIEPDNHTLTEMMTSYQLPEITTSNILKVYDTLAETFQKQLTESSRENQTLCAYMAEMESSCTEMVVNTKLISDYNLTLFINNIQFCYHTLASLLIKSTTNTMTSFNQCLSIFESELSQLKNVELNKKRVGVTNEDIPDNVKQILDAARPFTTIEGYDVYHYEDLLALGFNPDENYVINAFAVVIPYLIKPVIIVTKAMMQLVNSNELKVVLAHEYGHLVSHHVIDVLYHKNYKNSRMNQRFMDLVNEYNGTHRPLKNEIQADCYSIKFCGFDATISVLNKLQENAIGSYNHVTGIKKSGRNGIRFGYKEEIVERIDFFEKLEEMNKADWPDYVKKILL